MTNSMDILKSFHLILNMATFLKQLIHQIEFQLTKVLMKLLFSFSQGKFTMNFTRV